MQYRPDIDGMRAIAVLGVMFFHAGLGFPGGYVGVDVFFVISGFLITSIILNDLRNQRFSMIHFWGKRIRRILPAVSLVVLFILVVGWLIMGPRDYKRLGEQVLTLIILAANIKFWKENDYFDKAADTNPMLHTWSLSIEEQFYLFLPVILLLLFKFNRERWIYPLLWITITLSLVGSIVISQSHPRANFFLIPTRIWELDVGALLAFRMPTLSRRSANIFSIVGLSGILIPYFAYPQGITFPGISALPPVLGAAMIIIAGTQKGSIAEIGSDSNFRPLITKLLSIKPLVFIGLISYSLYLWHWPILAFQKFLYLDSSNIWIQLLLLISATVIAWISWRYVEQPFRKRSNFQKTYKVYIAGAVMTLLLLLPASYIATTKGVEKRIDKSMRQMYQEDVASPFRHIITQRNRDIMIHGKDPSAPILLGSPGEIPQIFVWGDSHTAALLPGLDVAFKELGIPGQATTMGGVPPVLNWYYRLEDTKEYNQKIFERICMIHESNPSLIVIMAARWESYFENAVPRVAPPGFREALSDTIQKLRENGIKIIIFKQVPSFGYSPPDMYMGASLFGINTSKFKTSLEEHSRRMAVINRYFESLQSDSILLFDPNPYLARENGDIVPVEVVDGIWHSLWADDNHMSKYGSLKLVSGIKKLMSDVIKTE